LERAQGRNGEAMPLYKRALSTLKKTLVPEHPETAMVQEVYAILHHDNPEL
jgi:hypothetical protein